MTDVKENAWEFDGDKDARKALSGGQSWDEIAADRARRAAEMIETLALAPPMRIFEVGSGDGTVAALLAPRAGHVHCLDISESFLALARKRCAGMANVAFERISGTGLETLPEAVYDAGFALNVFIHFNPFDMRNYLGDAARALKPGGCFYFDACSFGSATAHILEAQAASYRRAPGQVRGLMSFVEPETIAALVARAGLELVWLRNHGGWLKVLVRRPA